MPVERCTANGQPGWRWGRDGKCYTGDGARARAARQGAAIEAAKRRRMGAATVTVLAFLAGAVVGLASFFLALAISGAEVLHGCTPSGWALQRGTLQVLEARECAGGRVILTPTSRTGSRT